MLIAKALSNLRYEVYYLSSSAKLSIDFEKYVTRGLSKNSSKLFAVLIDEISPIVNQGLMTDLLRGPYKNLVVIGAAVPSELTLGISSNFDTHIGLSDLALRETDSDFVKLVDSLSGDDPILTSKICTYILKHCGGHVFPTLSFIEFFLSGGG